MKAVYLIGAPGVGKTTLMNTLKQDWVFTGAHAKPVRHQSYLSEQGTVIELGWDKQPFGGTDTLSYTAINQVVGWIPQAQLLFAEGDRLAVPRYMDFLASYTDLYLFHLTAPQLTVIQRRTDRAAEHNRPMQNPAWANGRATKHANLAYRYGAIELDATLPPSTLAQTVLAHLQ